VSQQIVRHTAVVLAGMASIGFTVAAGTYIVNQMSSGQGEDTVRRAQVASDPAGPLTRQAVGPIGAPTVTVRFAAETRVLSWVADIPEPVAPVAPPVRPVPPVVAAVHTNTGVGGRLPLLGDAYVGANLTRTQPDSLSMTVDTNLLAALIGRTDVLGAQIGDTRVRTDLDVANGEITLAVAVV